MISDYGRYYDAPGRSRRDCCSSDPIRGVPLKASDRKSPPRIDFAIREENVGWVHVPSTVSIVEGTDIGFRGDRSLWETVQTVLLLHVRLGQEPRLNAPVVGRIGGLEETCIHTYNQTKPRARVRKGEIYQTRCNTGIATQVSRLLRSLEVQRRRKSQGLSQRYRPKKHPKRL